MRAGLPNALSPFLPLCLVACALLLGLLQTRVEAQELPQRLDQTSEVSHSLAGGNSRSPEVKQALNNVDKDDSARVVQDVHTQGEESAVSKFECARQHVVVPGDTLLAIAIRYDVTVTAITQASGLAVAARLQVGRTLCIPRQVAQLPSQPPAESAPLIGGKRYIVKGGDTLSQIALNLSVPWDALARSNYLTDIDLLPVGRALCIPRLSWAWPAATDAGKEGTSYAVQEGDTLLGIALDHEVPLSVLLFANRLTECSLIRPGERLVIPGVDDTAAVSLPDQPQPPQEMIPLDFAYGIQGHALDEDNRRAVLAAVRDLGFTWLKQQVRWEDMEPHRGQRRWDTMDKLLEAADKQGVHVLFSVVSAPSWARERDADMTIAGPPTDNKDFADYLGTLASRYCGTLDAIEVWDEQNLFYAWGNLPLSGESYVQLLAAASASIREACPSIRIFSGALTPAGDNANLIVDDFAYMQQMLEAGMANHVDGIGAHPRGYNVPPQYTWQEACAAIQESGNMYFNGACDVPHHSWSFRSTMERYRALAVEYGAPDKPIVPTEFGWAVGDGHPSYGYARDNSLEEQADWTLQAFAMMQEWGWVGPAFLLNMNFEVVAPGTERALWSIVDADWSPKPVYEALKQLAK